MTTLIFNVDRIDNHIAPTVYYPCADSATLETGAELYNAELNKSNAFVYPS
jgi:hypothetical protein